MTGDGQVWRHHMDNNEGKHRQADIADDNRKKWNYDIKNMPLWQVSP